jgi:hypothetical protein
MNPPSRAVPHVPRWLVFLLIVEAVGWLLFYAFGILVGFGSEESLGNTIAFYIGYFLVFGIYLLVLGSLAVMLIALVRGVWGKHA